MKLNSIIFPAPKCSYTSETLYDELIYIPKNKESLEETTEEENGTTTFSSLSS